MSMSILSILQLAGISAAYVLVVLMLPWLFLRRRLAGFGSVSVRFMIYFLTGNFYIINLVYLLQLLHISCWLTLFFGTLAPFLAEAYIKYRGSFLSILEKRLNRLLLILGGEIGRKTLLLHIRRGVTRFAAAARKKRGEFIKTFGAEIFLVVGLIVLLLYMYGTNAVNVYGYCASDIVLHNYWINEMGHNNIFADGVYPFGMHCLLYHLHGLFGIHTQVLLRLFYVIQTVMTHLVLLAFLRSVCKSRYAPYIGIIIYIVSNKFYYYTYIRYHATLPQEMGMAFILPAAYFAMAFLQETNFASRFAGRGGSDAEDAFVMEAGGGVERETDGRETGKEKKKERALTIPGFYLALFAVSVSLTLIVHFYDTMIAGLFCAAIGAGFCFRVFRWKYFKRIVAAGIAGILLAVLPMAAAFATGTPLQASLNWGMAQMQSSASGSTQASGGSGGNEGLSALEHIVDRMDYFVAYDMKTAEVIVGSIGILFLLGAFWILFRKVNYGAVIISISIYMGAMAVLQASAQLGLIQILEVSRYSVYLGYGIPVVWSLCVDAVLFILFRKAKVLNFCSFAALTAACVLTAKTGMRAPVCVSPYETNEAMICLNNIIRENKDEAWTICSANDERQMLGDYKLGYHYEMIKFIRDMRSFDKDTTITIPTATVYFFVEKLPLLYRDYINTEKPERTVSREGARMAISERPGILPYIGDDRWVTMSHMYYWAQAFQELYPNEMEVYYESDNFVCYRVKQNGYSLYNFAIDYGYNGYDKTKKD